MNMLYHFFNSKLSYIYTHSSCSLNSWSFSSFGTPRILSFYCFQIHGATPRRTMNSKQASMMERFGKTIHSVYPFNNFQWQSRTHSKNKNTRSFAGPIWRFEWKIQSIISFDPPLNRFGISFRLFPKAKKIRIFPILERQRKATIKKKNLSACVVPLSNKLTWEL